VLYSIISQLLVLSQDVGSLLVIADGIAFTCVCVCKLQHQLDNH